MSLLSVIAWTVAQYLRFCFATTRWQYEGREAMEAIWSANQPVVLMFLHQRLHYGPMSWPGERARQMGVLISQSKSGELATQINAHFGYRIIRGSTAKTSDPSKRKGGAQAFRELLRWLRAGNAMAVTPDGPRGPAREMSEGPLKLSQLSGASIALAGISSSRFLTAKRAWDRQRFPLPFARGAVVWTVLPPVPADADEATLEALRLEAGLRLGAATDRADELAGARVDT